MTVTCKTNSKLGYIEENVTLFKKGQYYYILVSFTNLGNKSILLHVTNLFDPNSTVGTFTLKPFTTRIINLENNKTYAPCPQGVMLLPMVISENFTFYPGETIWYLQRLCYICLAVKSSIDCAFSHLVSLASDNYKIIITSWLTNKTITIPLKSTNIIGFYLTYQDGKMYTILPKGVCKIEVCGIQLNFTKVGNYEYEITNPQQLLSKHNCLTNPGHFIPLSSIIWIGGKEYNITIYSLSYLPLIC
ncbi:hypothetical protein HS5_23650 [Acidianus sp. HS-5]|nr:hypothetical protein HS5_23650 [Acidianus sp. HS-5]